MPRSISKVKHLKMMSAPCSQTTGFHIASKRSTDRGFLQAAPDFAVGPARVKRVVKAAVDLAAAAVKRVVRAAVDLVAAAVKRAVKVRVDDAAADLDAVQAALELPKQASFRPGQARAPHTNSAIKTAR